MGYPNQDPKSPNKASYCLTLYCGTPVGSGLHRFVRHSFRTRSLSTNDWSLHLGAYNSGILVSLSQKINANSLYNACSRDIPDSFHQLACLTVSLNSRVFCVAWRSSQKNHMIACFTHADGTSNVSKSESNLKCLFPFQDSTTSSSSVLLSLIGIQNPTVSHLPVT